MEQFKKGDIPEVVERPFPVIPMLYDCRIPAEALAEVKEERWNPSLVLILQEIQRQLSGL